MASKNSLEFNIVESLVKFVIIIKKKRSGLSCFNEYRQITYLILVGVILVYILFRHLFLFNVFIFIFKRL